MDLNKIRNGVIIGGFALTIYSLINLNYTDLTWTTNSSYYISLITGVCIVLSQIASLIYESKEQNK
jgi:hypothetical protein